MVSRTVVLVLFFLLATVPSWALTGRYRCMWREDPATTMVIGWDQIRGGNAVLFFDTRDNGRNINAYRYSKRPDVMLPAKEMNNTFARLTGLKPNTIYYFVIRDNEGISQRFSFRTAPDDPNTRLSIIGGGDSRNFRDARRVANRLVGKLRPHFVLFAGDMTGGDSGPEWIEWLDDWQETFGEDNRIFPIVTARGNHEATNRSLMEIFDVPSPDIYYSLNFGGGLLRVYVLNSLIASGGPQKGWLEFDLKKHTSTQWRMAMYHHAIRPHTTAKRGKDELWLNWAPLFHQYRVQLVLESDSHVSKWTYPIRPSTEKGSDEGFIRDDENGTVYIGEGCWGAPLRDNDDDKTWTRNSGSFNQFKWIFVDQEKIEIRTVKTTESEYAGEVDDQNIFVPPLGLVLWSPTNGEVVKINSRTVHVLAEKASDNTPGLLAFAQTRGGGMEDSWTQAPPLPIDPASGRVRVSFALEKPGDVIVQVLQTDQKEIQNFRYPAQTPGNQIKSLQLNNLPDGEYRIAVKAHGRTIQRYRLSKK